MGGMGSGTWCRVGTKTTVEDCNTLDVNRLARDGALRVGASGTISWSSGLTAFRLRSVVFAVSATEKGHDRIRLSADLTAAHAAIILILLSRARQDRRRLGSKGLSAKGAISDGRSVNECSEN